jgi:hypothetical protein
MGGVAKLSKLLLRVLCFHILPLGLFLLIVFSTEYRIHAVVAFCLLGFCLLMYGRNFRGNRVLFGIRADQFERILGVTVVGRHDEQDKVKVELKVGGAEQP